jgi:uncharacterized protein involved in type VI secretion and phage assembly
MTAITTELLTKLVERVEHRYYGKYQAQVVDNADPEGRARLRVRVPSVLGPDVVTGWAMPCVPYGGAAGQGFFFIPEKDAGVWVEFEGGDLSHPVWVGTFWSKPGGAPEPPVPNDAGGGETKAQSSPTRKIIKTRKGHTIQLEDADGDEMVLIVEATNKHLLVMNKDGIRLRDGANKHEVVLDSSGVTVKSDSVTVGDGATSEPFVLGQTFMANVASWFAALAAHTHVGNLGAPTSPPTPPLPPLQVPLSAKYKMKE